MKTIEISYDAAPHLAQTVGPFLTDKTAQDWIDEFVKTAPRLGLQEIKNVTSWKRDPGDGMLMRFRDLESGQCMSVQVRQFDEPPTVDLFTNHVINAIRSLPLRHR